MMASRTASVHWIWRDLRLSFAVLVFGAFSFGAILYFNGWISPQHYWSGVQARPTVAPQVDNDELYTGSVIVVPSRGEQCWQLMFDNRTGTMRENGYVNCYTAVRQLVEQQQSPAITSRRMQMIGSVFRGE